MDKKTLSLMGIILVIVGILFFFITGAKDGSLVSPQGVLSKLTNSPEPAANVSDAPAYNPPKDFKFDSNTNLSQELESINPEVSDSDFSQLKNLTK